MVPGWGPAQEGNDLSLRLRDEAQRFADEVQSLLNRTVGANVHLVAVGHSGGRAYSVGPGLRVDDMARSQPLKLQRDVESVDAYLIVWYQLSADLANEYLMVEKSSFDLAIELQDGALKPLVRYDYERDKLRYPEAHVQVASQDPDWLRLLGPTRAVDRIHLPVGGRRFRPTLEDFIEMLIVERLALPSTGSWHEAIQEANERFRQSQLRAAIRRDPETAATYLEQLRQGQRSKVLPKMRGKRRHRDLP